jgi:uncharacterized membrane protein
MKTTRWPVAQNRLSASSRCFARFILFCLSFAVVAQIHAKPLKVFILAGQSNMEGTAIVDAFQFRCRTTS